MCVCVCLCVCPCDRKGQTLQLLFTIFFFLALHRFAIYYFSLEKKERKRGTQPGVDISLFFPPSLVGLKSFTDPLFATWTRTYYSWFDFLWGGWIDSPTAGRRKSEGEKREKEKKKKGRRVGATLLPRISDVF